ncbi:envelope stress response activation lipoprotein NlpE [Enterobacillus tribolii]|uniref:Copper homeostasis protein (Lipoprotein) n=1 Tax=Enterobacillus tribolii TaxID=1487935 RepID=A0A370QPV6_9GAMM|nr:envelope stress response activation lipoprotein NlpE [Enterobacillus tribolii]MBW7981359.1 envelope stress response activation lipoprotein NlpE [Enterobacillus tribolii]RDK90735.1 copper homeostasis protein (lipoprotein) [Enterobacillus tribolii]
MKKLAITLLLAAGTISLFGCHARSQYTEQPLTPMAQSYQGVLPCADCSGMDTSLFLEKDGTFILKQIYRGSRDGDQAMAEYGVWQRTADKLVLTSSDGDKRYFHPRGNDMELLDATGAPIESSFNYVLKATDAELPTTPMAFKGMYIYEPDVGKLRSGSLQDCATGKKFSVAYSAALEKGYQRAAGEPGKPVYVEVRAHFSVSPSVSESVVVKTLVADSAPKFDANKNCR